MCTTTGAVERMLEGLSDLVSLDVSLLPDQQVRDELLALVGAVNQLRAAVLARVAVFDARGLAEGDGFRTTTGWLGGFGHVGRYAAAGTMKMARVVRELPALAAAAGRGQVSEDHLGKVVKLADDIGVVAVKEFDQILADLASQVLPADVGVACDRTRAHVDPDGPEPDPGADFDRRGVSLTHHDGVVTIKGRLDLEAGAALMTALDALTRPPTLDDPRTATQRRADALADLARGALASGGLPTVGGTRPQIGILIPADTLLRHAPSGGDPAELSKTTTPPPTADPAELSNTATPPPTVDPLTAAGIPPRPEPGWMDWHGQIPTELARRLACDSDVWRIVLDPTNGLPLDLGRAHRTAPHWLRKALHARDRGCRWPGCTVPSQWTDAHHWQHWIDGGPTNITNMLSLCRWHHAQAHEGGWTVHFDQTTGEISFTRPNGRPYDLAPSRPFTSTTTRRAA